MLARLFCQGLSFFREKRSFAPLHPWCIRLHPFDRESSHGRLFRESHAIGTYATIPFAAQGQRPAGRLTALCRLAILDIRQGGMRYGISGSFSHLGQAGPRPAGAACGQPAAPHRAQGEILHNGDMDCAGLLLVRRGQLRAYIQSEEGRQITIYRLFDRDMCLSFRPLHDAFHPI